MRTALISILFFFIFSQMIYGQVKDKKVRQQVLEKSIIDSLFVFGKWTGNGGTETDLKYLGQVTTKMGMTFKVLNSIWFWGLSHRATSRLLIFNAKNEYLGNYYISTTNDLPIKLKNGKLIFTNYGGDCDEKLITIVNMENGLPKQFFRKCKGEYGDICSFEAD